MSNSGYIVLRYVDDFMVLANTEEAAKAAYKLCHTELSKLNLSIHELNDGSGKTMISRTDDVTFLGIRLKDQKFYPGADAFARYKDKLDVAPKYKSLIKSLQYLQSLSQSWGATYNFCSNDPEAYLELNRALAAAASRTLSKSRLKSMFGYNRRQLRRIGIKKFDDAVALASQRKKLASKPQR